MDIRGVDPRDQTWEISQPKYRVYFHDAHGASEEYEVDAGEVTAVMDWAESQKGDRTFVLYACVTRDGLGLLRPAGRSPNER
jgi:hypothetical protein